MKPLIIANWKCNPTNQTEAKQLFSLVDKGVKGTKKAEVIICPPFLYFPFLKSSSLKMGAQNCFWEQNGAYTGEISPEMLKDLGCDYVIIGHSERRKYFKETGEIVNKKIKAVLQKKLNPILCIGETQEQRDQEKTEQVLKEQLFSSLEGISPLKFSQGIIAYEPIWAIGTGNACDFEESQKMGLLIRKIISQIYNPGFSKKLPLLYGGSVKSDNARGYIKEAGFQGLLVGGASLNAQEFIKIVKQAV